MSLPRVTTIASVVLTSLVLLGGYRAHAQSTTGEPVTRPERTAYRETSSYADVMEFVRSLAARSPLVHLTSFGYSYEGRSLPLVVVGRLSAATPEAARATGKTVVYVQANIHAGEVCGKEASLQLLRALAAGEHREWLDSLVLLFAPIYNADGNERVRLDNRPGQHGPVGGMGQRANAQDLDLNRDHMKLDAPETRSLVGLMQAWDPHVLMDLHTTNGTRHAYHLVYSPPLHPNTDPAVTDLLRNDWLPAVTGAVKADRGWDLTYYGNLPYRRDTERGWYTFDHRPRFNTNYIGLRNRFAILSEAYAYATFEDRIEATRLFVTAVLDYAYRHAGEIRSVTARADAADLTGAPLAVQATFARGDSVSILLGEVAEERNPYTGQRMLRRLEVAQPERMPEFGSFRPTETERMPVAYVVPAALTAVLDRLAAHGVRLEPIATAASRSVERFVIDSITDAPREFQGHRERTLFGRYEAVEETLPVGAVLVRTAQPLGRLAFALLEPRSDDGLAAWNFLDPQLKDARVYPILRIPAP
jgi:hypothetical protein